MICPAPKSLLILTALLVPAVLPGCTTPPEGAATESSPGPPTVSGILSNAVSRAERVARADNTNHFTYQRTVVMTDLDPAGNPIHRTVKEYQATLIRGYPHFRLAAVNGKDLTPEELEKENRREQGMRDSVTRRDKRADEFREVLFTQDIAARYDWTLEDRETLTSGPAYRLRFIPREPRAPVNSLLEHVFNHLTGHLWIHATDYEIARVDLELAAPVVLWGGVLGRLDQFELRLDRAHAELGPWYNREARVQLRGRRLWQPVAFRAEETTGPLRPLQPDSEPSF